MTTKIRIKVGAVEVEYEGPETFLQKKLPELVAQLSSHGGEVPAGNAGGQDNGDGHGVPPGNPGTLPSFLTTMKVGSNQSKRFLATAEWLHLRGASRVKTGEVTKALRDSHQKKLGNPAQCLNNNVASGYCEKVGKEFFVTDDGRSSLRPA